MTVRHAFRSLTLAAIAAIGLAAAPAAGADSSESSNWAGYAVHRSGVSFRKVLGSWTAPAATCVAGEPSYSSTWIGIGGYSVTSPALEQIGTEADCTAAGQATSTAWYELVPAASQAIQLTVTPGDQLRATVAVAGHRVTLALTDLTTHRSFSRTLRAAPLDVSSAEWIVEAPSVCSGGGCQTLPLADFGAAGFTDALATTIAGHAGSIADRRWSTSRITLSEAGRQFVANGGPHAVLATAAPSALSSRGSAFTITYQGTPDTLYPAERRQVAAAALVH